jgi:hypothetical protein
MRGVLRDRALRYATFLAAGDALAAFDAAGPALGIEISADGLRRLARVLAPDYAGDPSRTRRRRTRCSGSCSTSTIRP